MSAPGSDTDIAEPVDRPADQAAPGGRLLGVDSAAKAFGATKALVHCDLELYPGEIHALVGENGSGKSTLIKILSGVFRPDTGTVTWRGGPVSFRKPADARDRGISTVFQEVLIAEESSLRDNIFAGVDGVLRKRHDAEAEAELVGDVLERFGMGDFDLDAPVWRLSLGQKQLVTVARAAVRAHELLILDEPTSALDVDDRERLFAFVKELTETERISVLFVSHRMDEIQRLADRVTVLRAGRSVATIKGASSPQRLAELMSGRSAEADATPTEAASPTIRAAADAGRLRLVARDVMLRDDRSGFSVDVRSGEILGVAGLEGHGQVAFLEAVAGLRRAAGGTISIADDDGDIAAVRSFEDAFRKGVAYVPRDRKSEGIFAPLSILDNVAVPSLGRHSRFGILRRKQLRRDMQQVLESVQLQAGSLSRPISSLSGGNQQKVLLARWLAVSPKVLLLNDPTRGVDLGVKVELYRILRELANDGMAIVFLSTEVEELCRVCARIAVFHEQRCEEILDGELTPERVVRAMFGEVDQ
jgi:ABC-type sugar transport system ATPase subunit